MTIAKVLGISHNTVRNQVQGLFRKPAPSTAPSWQNYSGEKLEVLAGYCESNPAPELDGRRNMARRRAGAARRLIVEPGEPYWRVCGAVALDAAAAPLEQITWTPFAARCWKRRPAPGY
jgi:hypothetical protein